MTDQETIDVQHLDLLATFHYVLAAIVFLFGCFPIIHLVVGLGMVSGAAFGSEPGLAAFGALFIIIPVLLIASFWAAAIGLIFAGKFLRERAKYTYCLVIAGLSCMFMPMGTVLGVFTIIVLTRPSVKTLFGVPGPTSAPSITTP